LGDFFDNRPPQNSSDSLISLSNFPSHAIRAWLTCQWPGWQAPRVCLYRHHTADVSPPSLASAAFPPSELCARTLQGSALPSSGALFFVHSLPKMHSWHVRLCIAYRSGRVHIAFVAEARSETPPPFGPRIATPSCGSSPPPWIQSSWQSAYPPPLLSAPLSIWLRPYHQAPTSVGASFFCPIARAHFRRTNPVTKLSACPENGQNVAVPNA